MSSVCVVCGKPIATAYILDWRGQKACLSHRETGVKWCHCCGGFCDSHSVDMGCGELLCSECQKRLVDKMAAHKIRDHILAIYRNAPMGEISNFDLRATTAQQMLRLSGNPHVNGLAVREGFSYHVYFLKFVSKIRLGEILAHEILHIWQYNHNINAESRLTEGFCNLGSYVVLSGIGYPEAQSYMERLEKNPDPVYGDGFRVMLKAYKSGGWQAAISKLTEYKRR